MVPPLVCVGGGQTQTQPDNIHTYKEKGYISLHPGGIPHGPHPGAMERSIGQKETQELAVMVDTFRPLKLTQAAVEIADPSYLTSWLED